jgi:hypothetical protein
MRAVKKSILRGKLSDDNGKSDMEEDMNVGKEVNKDEDHIEQEDYTQMTMEERKAMGLLVVVTQEEACIAVKVCYVMEYREPDEADWPPIRSLNSLHDSELQPVLLKGFLLPAVMARQTQKRKRKGVDGNTSSAMTMWGLSRMQLH